MKKNRSRGKPALSRLRFPEEERLPWLPLLLELYALTDAGVAAAVCAAAAQRGGKPACREGCSVCCRSQTDIAVFPLELTGISWYCTEKLAGAPRAAIRAQLVQRVRGGPCPFLVAGSCAVYTVRPMACRHFTVLGAPCAEGEDPWHTRRGDVLTPGREALERAYRAMLPFHGITAREEQDEALARGIVRGLARNLPALDWQGLARMMDAFDLRGVPG